MQINFHSQHDLNPAAGRTPPYLIFTFGSKNYRVLTKQHDGFIQMTKIWAVFWFALSALLLVSSFIVSFELKIPFILLTAFCAHLLITVYAFRKRQQISNSVLYSAVNLLVFLIPINILAFIGVKMIIVPLCLYVAIQTVLSIKFMSNKSQIIAKFLILMEAIMISLKVDDKIQSSWRDIFFSHVVFFLFSTLCLLFMTAYLIYMLYKRNSESLMKQKIPGALFIYLNTFGFCCISALPLFYIFLNISISAICFTLMVIFIGLGAYILKFKKKIVVFFCTLNEIKSFDQIISFEPIQGLKQNQDPNYNKRKTKSSENIYFYKLSQNWMTSSAQKLKQNQLINPQLTQLQLLSDKKTLCLICLDKEAEVVWMPCGHFSVCLQCCSFMFQKRNLNCVLCKKTPEQIFIIEADKPNSKNDSKSCNKSESEKERESQNGQSKQKNQAYKDDSSVISSEINLVQKSCDKNTKINTPHKLKKQMKQDKKSKTQNKDIMLANRYKVLEGYNIKVI